MSSKTVDENYKRLRAELDEHLSKDKRLMAIADKISKGAADFSDTARYTQIVSKHMSDVIKRNIGELKQPMAKEMVCKELLRDHYELINGVFGEVQVSVDEKLGIHLNPIKPAYPAERVDKWAHSLEDPTVEPSVTERRAASGSENIGNSIHDDCIKENAKVREQAGLDCYLTRDAGGGCCPWCATLEGRFSYADAPDDIFRRHDNCTCTVTYECGRKRQDVWSKKTWEADPKDVEARIAASEASRPTVKTPAEAQAINEQSKSNITVLSKEQAEALNEQHKPTVLTEAEAKEREAKALGKDDNVNNITVDIKGKSDIMEESKAHKQAIDNLEAFGIKSVPTKVFDVIPSESEIINRLSGGDMTKGSCTSLALAYAGNKGGVDVLDYRGGKSCDFFSKTANIRDITKFNGVKANIIKDTNDFKAVSELLKGVETDREYILVTGRHTAVIRRSEKGFEYLNMQDPNPNNNGFKPLNTKSLKSRFKCQKSYKLYGQPTKVTSILLDRASLSESDEFKDVLKYINTEEQKQMKGADGSVR